MRIATSTPTALLLGIGVALACGALVTIVPLGVVAVACLTAVVAVLLISKLMQGPATHLPVEHTSAPLDLLLRLPIIAFLPLVGLRTLTNGLSLLPLLLLCAIAFLLSKGSRERVRADLGIIAVVGLTVTTIWSWLIGYLSTGTLTIENLSGYVITAASVAFLWMALSGRDSSVQRAFGVSLFDGVALYLLLNVVLYFGFGLTSPASELRSTPVGFIGLFGDTRVIFPLTNSLSLPAVLAAGYVVGAPVLLRSAIGRDAHPFIRLLRLVAIGAGIVVILSTGSRVAVIACAALGAFTLLRPLLFARWAGAILVCVLLVPFWWFAGQRLLLPLGEALTAESSFFGRSDRNESQTLGNRSGIWNDVMTNMQTKPTPELVFGFGANGHIPAHLVETNAKVFDFLKRPEDASVHNSLLQQLVDQGIVGSIVFVAFLLTTTGSLARRFFTGDEDRPLALALLLFMTTMGATASTEEFWSTGSPADPFWILLMVALLARELNPALKQAQPEREGTDVRLTEATIPGQLRSVLKPS